MIRATSDALIRRPLRSSHIGVKKVLWIGAFKEYKTTHHHRTPRYASQVGVEDPVHFQARGYRRNQNVAKTPERLGAGYGKITYHKKIGLAWFQV